ncbi:putative cell wall glycosyl hydrolase [Diaporthe ampelina]|uniref:Putative cell wall glycosyl hydrolase n=1 Tax=Diaporthe ampelina TaxID=1214573 RepID=A0A0G2HSP1_9PEZI|nr:putative cell wall glycosyl hydrolase [Diaporthe ampelina]
MLCPSPGVLTLAAATASASAQNATTEPLSTRMIESAISRQQGVVSSGAVTSTLESGILALSTQAWLELYGSSSSTSPEQVADFVSYVDEIIASVSSAPAFSNASAAALLPLDRLSIAQAIMDLEEAPAADGELMAAEALTLDTLNSSLVLQRRNQLGGLWYYVYPHWSYLDGAVSFLPYMAEPSSAYAAADMLLQITLLYDKCFQGSTGLVVHGYDASKAAVWANNATGASPYVWGRSLGWYLAGLVNAWEVLTAEEGGHCAGSGAGAHDGCADLLAALQHQAATLTTNLARYADEETGVWWQLPTFPGREGNFLESSSTALYIFSILKGQRLGLLEDDQPLADVALRAYDYTAGEFVVDYGNGTLGWNGTVIVCSLNSTATYEYYTGRPVVFNAPLGEAAFVWASLEVERLRG